MTVKELLSKVEDIESKLYYDMGKYRQFTIDTIDDILDELNNHLQEPFQVLTDDDLVGSLIYRIKCIMRNFKTLYFKTSNTIFSFNRKFNHVRKYRLCFFI